MAAVSESKSTPAVEPSANGFLDREALLKGASRAEERVDIPGLGRLLCAEISGEDRAKLIGRQVSDVQAQREYDRAAYEKRLLLAGIVDPSSPADARLPLLKPGDVDALMRMGAGKISVLVTTIERLSGLGPDAVARAEGNSGPAGSGSVTSS